MAKQLMFNEDARKKLLNGVEQITKAVRTTLGPGGRMVMIDTQYGTPTVTKDGVSVAREVSLVDPFENMGAQFVREVAAKTNDDAGDGTTTSTVLAHAIVREGIKAVTAGMNPVWIKRGLDSAADYLEKNVRQMSKSVSGATDIINIASISANNDPKIGKMIADAIEKVGQDGIITVEESNSVEMTVDTVEGMQFDRGYISPYFITDRERMECVLKDPFILIYDKKISNLKEILPVLEATANAGKPLLIICDELEGDALGGIVLNTLRGTLHVCAVKAPGFGDNRKDMLQDIAILTGGTFITDELGYKLSETSLDMLGTASSIKVTKDSTLIVDGSGDKKAIDKRANEIKVQIGATESSYNKEQLQKRLAKLAGGVAVIKVGASTEPEMKELKFRIEDTISATKAALEEGIVPGGGIALIEASKGMLESLNTGSDEEDMGWKILYKAVQEPLFQIASNSGEDGGAAVARALSEKKGIGLNARTGEWVKMIDAGIIDPTKVTCSALRNAVSVAGTMLTTECVITDIPEQKPANELANTGMGL